MNREDDMKETFQEGDLPGTGPRDKQLRPGRNQATARMKWTKGVNKLIIKCYIKSNPTSREYRKGMLAFLKEEGVCEFSEWRLADQARAIKINEWVSDVEIEEIRRKISES